MQITLKPLHLAFIGFAAGAVVVIILVLALAGNGNENGDESAVAGPTATQPAPTATSPAATATAPAPTASPPAPTATKPPPNPPRPPPNPLRHRHHCRGRPPRHRRNRQPYRPGRMNQRQNDSTGFGLTVSFSPR